MKKVAFLVNSLCDGGAERVVKDLCEKFYETGISLELICLETMNIYNLNKNIKVTYLSSFTGKEKGILKLLYIPILAFKLKSHLKKNKIELIQSHLFRASYVNVLSKVLFRSSHEVQIVNHSIISRYKNNGLLGKVNISLIKVLFPFAKKIISVSNIVQFDMQKMFNFKNQKSVIHNMFDLDKINTLSFEKVSGFKFEIDRKYLIVVGRLVKLKRNNDIMCAISNLDKDVEVIFVGDGNQRENLQLLSTSLNISNRVHFLGWVDNPYKYIRNSDILISASETESFGNVLVEAMICQTPVISTRSGGPEEIIQDNINGSLIDIGDVESLVKKVNVLLKDDDIKNKYVINSNKTTKLFDIDCIVNKYKRVLEIE